MYVGSVRKHVCMHVHNYTSVSELLFTGHSRTFQMHSEHGGTDTSNIRAECNLSRVKTNSTWVHRKIVPKDRLIQDRAQFSHTWIYISEGTADLRSQKKWSTPLLGWNWYETRMSVRQLTRRNPWGCNVVVHRCRAFRWLLCYFSLCSQTKVVWYSNLWNTHD